MKKTILFTIIILFLTNVFAGNVDEIGSLKEPALIPVSQKNTFFLKFSSPFIFFSDDFYSNYSESDFLIGLNQGTAHHNIFSGLQLSAGYSIPEIEDIYVLAKFALYFDRYSFSSGSEGTSSNTGVFLFSPGIRAEIIDDGIWNVFTGVYLNFYIAGEQIGVGPELFVGFDREIINCLHLGSDFGMGYLHKSFNSGSVNGLFIYLNISATFYLF